MAIARLLKLASLDSLAGAVRRERPLSNGSLRHRARPRLEVLEDRLVPSSLVVVSASGSGSYDYTAITSSGTIFRPTPSPVTTSTFNVEPNEAAPWVSIAAGITAAGSGSDYTVVAHSNMILTPGAVTTNATAQANANVTLKIQADPGEDPNAQVLVEVTIIKGQDGTVTVSAGNLTASGQYLAKINDEIPIQISTNFTGSATNPPDYVYLNADTSVEVDVAPAPLADITPTDLAFDTAGDVNYGYTISSADLSEATTVDLYWASGTTPNTKIGNPIVTTTTDTAQGTYPLEEPRSDLGIPQAGAEYILAVVDPDGDLPPSENPDGVQSLELPELDVNSITLHPDTADTWASDPDGAGGVDVTYQITGTDLPAPVPIALYWASGTTINTANSGALTQGDNGLVLMTNTSQGGPYSFHVPAEYLETPPQGTTNLLVVLDPPTTMLSSTPTQAPAATTDGYGQLIEATDQSNVDALSVSASVLLSNSVHAYVDPDNGALIQGEFMPAEGPNPPPFNQPAQGALTLCQAEAILGVDHFNWLQQVTYTPPTLQPETFKNLTSESGLFKVTGDGLRYVTYQNGNYAVDPNTSITALYRSAPFVDPIVPEASANYVPGTPPNYARGFIIDNKYAYAWAVDPPPDGFFYYWNEPVVSPEDLSSNTTSFALYFSDQPEQPSFTDPFDPSSTISPFTSDPTVSYLGFGTSLVGVIDDKSPQDYTTWSSAGYMTNFDWKSNTAYNADTGDKDDTSGNVSDIAGWGTSPGSGGEPTPSSGGVFGIEPSDEVAAGTQLLLNPIPDSTGSPGQTIALTALAQDPAEGQTLTYSLAPGYPSGASINPATGSFTWTIPATEPLGAYPVTINVTDDASPPLTASTSFTIHVTAPPTLQSSSFSSVSGSGAFGGTATLTATLTSGGSPLTDEVVSFALDVNGSVTPLGTATTDANGIATLPDASIAGANVGTDAGVLTVNFAGDATYQGSTASGSLTVSPRDVSSQVSVTSSGLVYNRSTQRFGGTMTLTNTGTSTLDFSFEVVLTNLPAGVTLANATGYTADGDPYILVNLPGGALAPGQSVTFTVQFNNPSKKLLQYGAMIFNV